MTRWEYRVCYELYEKRPVIVSHSLESSLEYLLNAMGDTGWEAISVQYFPIITGVRYEVVFKRPVEDKQ